jgi:phosphoribosylanthranilate isomerase
VKICGITREEDIHLAVKFGADALGFVYGYKESKRNIPSFESLKLLVSSVPPYVSSVVVTPASSPELLDVILGVRPTYIQIVNDEEEYGNVALVRKIRAKTGFDAIIQTVHIEENEDKRTSQEKIIEKCRALSHFSKAILLDSKATTDNDSMLLGGTGVAHDWHLSRKIRDALAPKPLILAGGLSKENIVRAIKVVEPYAVDVSSSVERKGKSGVKDEGELKEFIRIAKSAH